MAGMKTIPSDNLAQTNKELNEIGRKLLEIGKGVPGVVNRTMVIEANELRNVIIESMMSTPRMLRSRKSSGSGLQSRHHPSAPGFPPAIDKGELIRSILYDVEYMEMRVGAGLGTKVGNYYYAEVLENSKNPNMKRPWLDPAVKKNKDRIMSNINNAVNKEFYRNLR